MFKGIKFIVETNSAQERNELVNYLAGKRLLASVISSGDGLQYLAISIGDVWFVSTVNKETATKPQYQHFRSAKEFIKSFQNNNW